jgi:orotate phosphoribosyltransferase
MELVPTQDDVVALLRETGGLRTGHFEYPNGLHVAEYLQVALTMRSYAAAKTLSVGLSRLVRANPEIRAIISELSIVAPATGGLPVAYGVCEALRARRVYWSEPDGDGDTMRLRQFLEVEPGEKILLVDDILRSGRKLQELRSLVESRGGEVAGVAVIIHEPQPNAAPIEGVPFYCLAKLDQPFYRDAASCEQCRKGVPAVKVWV